MKSGRTGVALDIINPEKLGPERRDGVCAQCHLAGESRIVKAGREQRFFQPGELLSDQAILLPSSPI
ncbi:MAG: hypothetical protein HY235_26805 [Acidobacteria bacterium]|nr:hypothetical protein [Acidobacteriota bacterium]